MFVEKIISKGKTCQKYVQAPRRFNFALCDDRESNHNVFVEIFYINKNPILNVVAETTHYQTARWLPNVTTDTVWRAMRVCWVDVYLGTPDIVAHHAGKQSISKVFQTNAALLHITTKSAPIESPNPMSYAERYHTPMWHAYKIVLAETVELDTEAALQIAVKSVNDSIGPDGQVRTLLVYGALPRLGFPDDPPKQSMFRSANALRQVTEAMTKHFAESQVSSAVRTRTGPDILDINLASIDSHVLVHRPELDKRERPFTLLGIQGEIYPLLLPPPSVAKQFRTTVIKRFILDEKSTDGSNNAPTPTSLPSQLAHSVDTSKAINTTI